MSISGELKQQIAGVLELSAEALDAVEGAVALLDSAVVRLTTVLAASHDPKAAQAVRSLVSARENLTEVAGLFDRIAGELPVFLDRLGRSPSVEAENGPVVVTSYGRRAERATSVTRPATREDPTTETRTYTAWWDTKSREIAGAGEVESVIREAAGRLVTDGVRGIAIRVGDGERNQAPLRIDIDTAAGRAAVSWNGGPGAESGVTPEQPLVVRDDPKRPPVTVPVERSRVTPEAAIRAAREYVDTGQRPTCLEWYTDPDGGEDAGTRPPVERPDGDTGDRSP